MTNNPSTPFNKFLKDNLQAIAKERLEKAPCMMPKNALFLQAARLVHQVHGDSETVDVVDTALNRLCLVYTAEGK